MIAMLDLAQPTLVKYHPRTASSISFLLNTRPSVEAWYDGFPKYCNHSHPSANSCTPGDPCKTPGWSHAVYSNAGLGLSPSEMHPNSSWQVNSMYLSEIGYVISTAVRPILGPGSQETNHLAPKLFSPGLQRSQIRRSQVLTTCINHCMENMVGKPKDQKGKPVGHWPNNKIPKENLEGHHPASSNGQLGERSLEPS